MNESLFESYVKMMCCLLSTNLSKVTKPHKIYKFLFGTLINGHYPLLTSTFVHFYGSLKKYTLSEITQDINVDELKRQCLNSEGLVEESCIRNVVNKELEKTYTRVIQNLSASKAKILKCLIQEHAFLYAKGHAIPAPQEMISKHWLEAMTLQTMEDRLIYYSDLGKLIVKQYQTYEKSKVIAVKCEVKGSQNSFILETEFNEREMMWTNNKLASAMQFGIPLVIDMGFSVSNLTELIPLGQQIWNLYCSNRRHSNPFHLVFTNCSQANDIIRYLELHHFVESSMILASFTEKSHLDLFSHSKLVYLSSQAKKCVQAFDLNKVYILGAYHDPLVRKKSSYSRSREQNILSLCLPINQQVKWSHQLHKDLDLHHIINILLSVKESNCWKTAFVSTVPDFVAEVL